MRSLGLAFLALPALGLWAREPIVFRPYVKEHLFTSRMTQSDDYNDILPILAPGDFLKFNNGAQFQIIDELGHDQLTLIYRVRDLRNQKITSLRLPLLKGSFRNSVLGPNAFVLRRIALRDPQSPESQKLLRRQNILLTSKGYSQYLDYFQSSLRTHEEMKNDPFPKMEVYDLLEGQYLSGEVFEPPNPSATRALSLLAFLAKPDLLPIEEQGRAVSALETLAAQMILIQHLHDFRCGQVLYNPLTHLWKVVDLDQPPERLDPSQITKTIPENALYAALKRAVVSIEKGRHATSFANKMLNLVSLAQAREWLSRFPQLDPCTFFWKSPQNLTVGGEKEP